MSSLELPADTVELYNDGPSPPTTPLLIEAERAFRESFASTARLASGWKHKNEEALRAAWRSRNEAEKQAEVPVPSSELFGDADMDSEQVVYRVGHEVNAARTRDAVHALDMAFDCWDNFGVEGVPDDSIGPLILRPWADRLREWARAEIDPAKVSLPPQPDECIPDENRPLLAQLARSTFESEVENVPSALLAKSVRQLLNVYPELRPPVIHGLLREGETMNVISAPKIGKSWLVTDLALAVAIGRPWLDMFETERGAVLIIDNELHGETSANRIPKVMEARGIALDDVADRIFVANMRGRLKDIFNLADGFEHGAPGRFKLIVLDAFYRFLPRDTDENDNGTMSQVYNHIDALSAKLGCSFVLIHHASKGNQSGKSVTDVGAGAGSQARTTDTHLILRPHEEEDCVVLDAAVRSWPPVQPRCLRWAFPVWIPDDGLDPTLLRPERPRRRKRDERDEREALPAKQTEWTAERFVLAFAGEDPRTTQAIVDAAIAGGMSERCAKKLIRGAEASGLLYRWTYGSNRPIGFATIGQPKDQFHAA